MRYVDNGIEIQYRECQILRDAASPLFTTETDVGCSVLVEKKETWIGNIKVIAKEQGQKREYCTSLEKLLQQMELSNLEAVAEYTEYLVKKKKGIDIMEPYITHDKLLILPVNKHEPLEE